MRRISLLLCLDEGLGLRRDFYPEKTLITDAQQSSTASAAWDVLSSLLKKADKKLNSESASASINGLADQNSIFQTYCERDYSSACPPDWREAPVSGHCLAGLSYSGSLDPYFPIPITKDEKAMIEDRYDIRWPCVLSCSQDYVNNPCPEGWMIRGSGICLSHDPKMPQDFNGFDATVEERRVFSTANNIPWPCAQTCQKDYHNFICPIGWDLASVNNALQCEAPSWYQGGCPSLQGLMKMTVDDLRQFESRCHIQYPCRECQNKNYASACPLGWLELSDGCQAPESIDNNDDGANRDDDTLIEMRKFRSDPKICSGKVGKMDHVEEKIALEDRCGVSWECLENSVEPACVRDYTYACPMLWKTLKMDMCSADENYKGRCPSTMRVLQNEIFKRAMAQHCQVSWPCKNDSSPKLWTAAPGKIPRQSPRAPAAQDEGGPIDHIGHVFRFISD